MPIGTTNISLAGIYDEANPGGGTPSNVSAGDLFRYSYFQGPNGSGTIGYNAWGMYGSTTGDDVIYGLPISNTNLSFNNFSGEQYFYDNTTFKAEVNLDNTKQAPPFAPPTPPSANDTVIEIDLFDSTGTYIYSFLSGTNLNPQQPQSLTFSNTDDPLIDQIYWEVRVGTDQFFPTASGTVTIDINGTTYVAGAGLATNTPPSGNVFNWGSYGAASVNASGVTFDITIN